MHQKQFVRLDATSFDNRLPRNPQFRRATFVLRWGCFDWRQIERVRINNCWKCFYHRTYHISQEEYQVNTYTHTYVYITHYILVILIVTHETISILMREFFYKYVCILTVYGQIRPLLTFSRKIVKKFNGTL
jgi:hypothetical protein